MPENHDKGSHRVNLPQLAVRRPVTMLMLFISLIVVGCVAWLRIPLQLFPEGLDPPFLFVWISYPNSSPIENQERISTPVEEHFWTVKGVKKVNTRSTSNYCRILVEFTQQTDMNVAYLEMRDRLERVKPELPDDLKYVYIFRYSENDEPVMWLGVSVQGNYDDPNRLIEDEVKRKFERVDGVAKVEVWGSNTKLVRIELMLEKLKSHNVSLPYLLNLINSSDFAIPGGHVIDSEKQLLVRLDGHIRSIEVLSELPIIPGKIYLKDIARISYSEPERTWKERIGGKEAIEIGVYKESGSNTVQLSQDLKDVLHEIRNNPQLRGFEFDILFDQGNHIVDSLRNLRQAGLWGAFFAVMVLFYFLRRVGITSIITLAIPLCLLITIACMYFWGWSLNIITMSGLMISVGLVVDNAIVVSENIMTVRRKGISIKKASVIGASEVALAITLATLTTGVVFLPIMLMSGDRMLTFFMLRIGMPVIIALSASLLAALIFIPLAVNKLSVVSSTGTSNVIDGGTRFIGKTVKAVLSNRLNTVVILILLLSSISFPIKLVTSTDAEEGHINDLRVRFNFPAHYSINDVDSTLRKMENYIYSNSERFNIKTIVTGFRSGFGRMRIFMNEDPNKFWLANSLNRFLRLIKLQKKTHLTRREVIEDLKEHFIPPPGVEMHADWNRGRGEEESVYITLFGDDTQRLINISEDVKRRLKSLPGAISIETDLESSSDELLITFDRELMARYSIDPLQSATGITSMIRGIDLQPIRLQEREIKMRAELLKEDRSTLSQVMNLPVGDDRHHALRLGDVATVDYSKGLGEITRENRRTRLRIKISTTEDDLEEMSDEIDNRLKNLVLPTGYEWGKGARFSAVAETRKERNQTWLLAIMFVFLLMGALFESFTLPLVVIVTIPFSFFGVWWLLFLTASQFGVMSVVGVVILIGIVVNNAIVLVDRVNRLRSEGMRRDDALILAAKQRFKPILMTAATTVMGLVPMAFGDANLIGIPYAPMGRAIIGGMITATITTPIVVPLAYSLLDDLQIWMRGYYNSFSQYK